MNDKQRALIEQILQLCPLYAETYENYVQGLEEELTNSNRGDGRGR